MAKTKYVKGVPNWIQDPVNKERLKHIKDNSYSSIEGLALKGKMPTSATQTIPKFLEVLADGDTMYKDFKKKHINTTFALTEKSVKVSITQWPRLEKKIKLGKIVVRQTNKIWNQIYKKYNFLSTY